MPSQPDPFLASLAGLPGVGPARLDLFGRLGLRTVRDLLFHFPRRYEDLTDVRRIAELVAGKLQTVQGEVVEVAGRSLADGRPLVSIVVSDDGKHVVEGTWFNQPYAARRFRYGQRVYFSGKPKWFRDHWQMNTPQVQPLDKDLPAEGAGIVPVYPLTEGLHPETLRAVLRQAVDRHADQIVDILPPSLRRERRWPAGPQALRDLHFPVSLAAAKLARRRFVYEELLLLQLALALRRRELRDQRRAPTLPTSPLIDTRIRRLFPFKLTADQDRAVADVVRDLASDRPMQRLLQADVGAGKTAVAVYALLVAVANKHQAALMAPTEVLARQHAETLDRYLAGSRVRRLLLTGGLSQRDRRAALTGLREGTIDLVVGTQALVQEDVRFSRLGLVVIDEQHKFGVHQRARLRELSVDPHYLVMTATPIPRTVALTVFGDLDVSVIRELPPGRQPLQTQWVEEKRREWVFGRFRAGVREGRQGYVVCPLEESETLDVAAAVQVHADLETGALAGFRLGLLHGRLDESAKAALMQRFHNRQIDVLVCTPVIEVGVDVPNATLMIVEHAERFGLSQLHQLRGRVSRGTVAGECFLFAGVASDDARTRLRTLARTTDGFALAEEDARLRGPGELFGTRQHGAGELQIASLISDPDLLRMARADAISLVADDAGLARPEHALLKEAVLQRYGKTLHLGEVG